MADLQILEGTGRELLPPLEQYSETRFRLIPLSAETQEKLDNTNESKPVKEVKSYELLKGRGTTEDFLRRKREDLEWEDRNLTPLTAKSEETSQTQPVKRSRSYGILKGLTSNEDFMRRKQEEIELEDKNLR